MTRRLRIVIVNLLVFAVLAEAAGLLVYYYEHGWLFYAQQRQPYELIQATKQGRLTGEALHPYFGPTHKPGIPFDVPDDLRESASTPERRWTNNFGFVSPFDYPFTKTNPRQFIIGLFGGSVGAWFCQVGASRLIADLQREGFFREREAIPVCLSHEGYKQPQELLLLTYFLSIGQQFDLVVNIDGFNDVALGGLNDASGLDVSMPSVRHIDGLVNLTNQATLTPEKLASLARIAAYKVRLNDLAGSLNGARFASMFVILERYRAIINGRYERELIAFDKLPSNPAANSLIQVTSAVRPRPGVVLFEDIAAAWATSSLMMNDLLAARGVPYFHVLQPNQYYSTRKASPAEAATTVSADSPYGRNVAAGYPQLVTAPAATGLARRVRFIDGVHMFDDEARAVYRDNCCHYTLVGNQRMADVIASAILRSPGPWHATPRENGVQRQTATP